MEKIIECIKVYLDARFDWEQRNAPKITEAEEEKFINSYKIYADGETERFALEMLQAEICDYYGLEKEKENDRLYCIYVNNN